MLPVASENMGRGRLGLFEVRIICEDTYKSNKMQSIFGKGNKVEVNDF